MTPPSQHENLSALVDGELRHEQMRFVLRGLDHDVGLRAAWTRYHLIRDGVRQQVPLLASEAFAARVMDAIGQAPAATAHGGQRRWLHWSAGGAIAAGVAAVALMVVQPPGTSSHAPATVATELTVAPDAPQTAALQPASAPTVPRWLSATPPAGRMTQPAAATFYPGAPVGTTSGYSQQLPSYMMVPSYRMSQLRQARNDAMPPRWLAAPQSADPQPPRQALHLH